MRRRLTVCVPAVAALLAAGTATLQAQADSAARSVDELVPMPDTAPLAPLTPADVGATPSTGGGIDLQVPLPAPANVAPPSLADVTGGEASPAVVEALRALIGERAASVVEDRRLREALAEIYEARGHKPFWIEAQAISARGRAVLAAIGDAAADGLDPKDYPLPVIDAARADPEALARAELRLTASAVAYARHAIGGRVDPARVHPLVTPRRTIPTAGEVMDKLAGAADPGAELTAFNPPHKGYQALRRALAEARAAQPAAAPAIRIPEGALLRPGASDPRVPALRQRLGVAAADTATYDEALVAAVRAFQARAGVEATGLVGPQTVAALNRGPVNHVNDLIANMERWRWLPRDLGDIHIFVNIPEFTARVWRGETLVHRTRVIVGKPETPTPVFSDSMEHVVVNPAWHVPPSIVRNEMLPLLASDPGAITRQGLEVLVNGRPVDPYALRYGVDANRVSFRQPPGERNALGQIKFMFPNNHHVYMHDTPKRSLFANERRAYSHGCIRVHEPLKFGEIVFGVGLPGEGWTQARIAGQFGASERYIRFREHIPVHVTYFTVHADESGNLVSREDIYRHNAQVKALLGLEGQVRSIAPQPVASRPAPVARPAEPPNFFEQLFGIRPARGG